MPSEADFRPDGWEHGGVASARLVRTVGVVALAVLGIAAGTGLAIAGASAAVSAATGALGEPKPESAQGLPDQERRVIGTSVRGRPIIARVIGDPEAPRSILIVGCIHGTERAGEAVTAALRSASGPPEDTNRWVIDQANPDGCAAGTRQNARGVDLNRQSSWRWGTKDRKGDTFYAGSRAWSEPEARAIRDLVRTLRPAVSVWFHQHAAMVDTGRGRATIERRYARTVGLPARNYGTVRGSITSWQNDRFRDATAFVVELRAGRLSAAAVARHVQAIEDL